MQLRFSVITIICIFLFFQVGAGVEYTASADAHDTFSIIVNPAGLPIVTTNNATNVEETTVTLNGLLVDDGGVACQYRFQYDIDAGEPYADSTTWMGAITTGQTFSQIVSSLTKGELYFFRAQCQNVNGINSGDEKAFLTKPDGPTGFQATRDDVLVQINLIWIKGEGADKTTIVRKIGSYPADRTDGLVVYNGTTNRYEDGAVIANNHYYYRAWSYCSEGWLHWYSDDYDEDSCVALAPATFDIRDILIIDDVLPDLEISVIVENKGGILVDITVSWVLKRTDNNDVLDMGSDTFAVSPYSEVTYTIYPTINYEGSVIITFSGDGAVASGMFTTKSPAAPGPPSGAPPRPPRPVVPVIPPAVPAPAVIPSWMIIAIFAVAICLLVFFIILIKREEEEEKNTSKRKSIHQMFTSWWNSLE